MFICFINFYWFFIEGFSRIVALLTFILKITRLSNLAQKLLKADNNEVVEVDGRANKTVMNLFNKNNKSKNLIHMPNIGAIKKYIFLTPNAKKTFNHLKQAFVKALILLYFDPECYIWIKTNILGYILDGILSLLNLNSNITPKDSISNKSNFNQ